MLAIESPFPQFFDLDGETLNSGSLFFGVANQNPETNPITVYWDAAGTQPAAQPIQTINGFIVRNGTPATLFANSDYSLNVRNLRGNLVFYAPTAADANLAVSLSASSGSSLVGFLQAGSGATARTVQAKLREVEITPEDFGAVGNGVADDHTAISNAFTAAAGRIVRFGGGKSYKLASSLAAPAGSLAYMEVGAAFVTNTPTNVDFRYERASATATAGSIMKIDHLQESSTVKLQSEAEIWPGKVETHQGFSKEFGASNGQAGSPCIVSYSFGVNSGSPGDIVAHLADCVANAVNATAFAANLIARSPAAASNVKLVGLEIDVEPGTGSTVNGASAGAYINAFNVSGVGPAIQFGGVSGGQFSNGMLINSIASSGAAVAAQSGLSCTTFIDTTQAVLTGPAAKMAQSQVIQWQGAGGTSSMTQNAGGQIIATPATSFSVQGPNTTEGNTLFDIKDSGGVQAVIAFVARGSPANGANAAMKVNGQSVTGRSINAGGTINASGADYAEYEVKRADCGDIAKGQIIGFDKDGRITDKWAKAISFGIKSTAPSLVGGDVWDIGIGNRPEVPAYSPPSFDRPKHPSIHRGMSAEDAQIAFDEFDAEMARYELAMESDFRAWEARELPIYEKAISEYESRLEVARKQVDRIAYCGKIPLNFQGATPGDYIVPVQSGDDISAFATASPTFEQYQIAVGRVRKILPDGRAEIVVKPI